MPSPAAVLKNQQRAWAASHDIAVDSDGYTSILDYNLFQPMSPVTRSEFKGGDGGELGLPGQRGKMQALHSSSALACNVFDYWRDRDRSPLVSALGLAAGIEGIEFERKFPSGLPGNAPNLDVVLSLANGSIVAVESKFLEPYGKHTQGFKQRYFDSDEGRWARFGYRNCQGLASRLQAGAAAFRWLHAEQLLKHILGLAASAGQPWELLYLWYAAPTSEAVEHAAEAEEFARIVKADEIAFRSMSYQSLFASMRSDAGAVDSGYIDYLGQRYVDGAASY